MSIIKSKWKNTNIEFNTQTEELTILDNKLPESGSNNPRIINKKDKINRFNIKTITFKKTPVILPKNSDALFKNFTRLESIILKDADFQNVESMNELFANTPLLTSITIGNIINNHIQEIRQLITNASKLTEININKVSLNNLESIENLISARGKLPKINIKEARTPKLTKIDGVYDNTHITQQKIYEVNTAILNQAPLKELTLIKNSSFKDIHIKNLNVPPYCNIAQQSQINDIKLPKNTTITPLATMSDINKINIKHFSNISDINFLSGCLTNEVIDLEQFKPLTNDEVFDFLKKRYASAIITTPPSKIKAGKYKNTIITNEEAIEQIIFNNVLFIDISLKSLESSLFKYYQKKPTAHIKQNIIRYSKLYNDDKTLKVIQKKLNVLEKLTKHSI